MLPFAISGLTIHIETGDLGFGNSAPAYDRVVFGVETRTYACHVYGGGGNSQKRGFGLARVYSRFRVGVKGARDSGIGQESGCRDRDCARDTFRSGFGVDIGNGQCRWIPRTLSGWVKALARQDWVDDFQRVERNVARIFQHKPIIHLCGDSVTDVCTPRFRCAGGDLLGERERGRRRCHYQIARCGFRTIINAVQLVLDCTSRINIRADAGCGDGDGNGANAVCGNTASGKAERCIAIVDCAKRTCTTTRV